MKVIILPVTFPAWLAPCPGRARPLVALDDTEQRSDAAVSKRLGRGGLKNRLETAGFWRFAPQRRALLEHINWMVI